MMPTGDSSSGMFISLVLPRGISSVGNYCKLAVIGRRFPTVSGSNHEHRDIGPAGTLGDLLYADPAKPRVSESEWRELVAAIAAGDQLAFRALYDRTHRLVFTLTMRILGNHASAEEITLDVFHDVWRRAPTYDGDGRIGAGMDHESGAVAGDRPAALRRSKEANLLRSTIRRCRQ